MRDAIELGEIGTRHLDPDRAFDAGRKHVDAVSDRRHPDIGEARELDRAIKLFDELVGRHPRPPLIAWLELDCRLEHLQRCWVGRSLGAAGLAEHALHLRYCLDQPVGLLARSEEHTTELQSLMRISYAVFCLKKKNTDKQQNKHLT